MPIDRYIEDKKHEVEVDIPVEGAKGVVDFDKLKSGGLIKQRQKDMFTVRCRCPGGRVPVEKLKKMVEVAEKVSRQNYVHMSFRQSVEVPYIHYKDFGKVVEILGEADAKVASCGPRVRVPTACSGCEYNPNGLMDTQKMAKLVDEKYFGIQCNHKFKISFSGCPIDCARTHEMDLAFQGAIMPVWDQEPCTACGICAAACMEGAITAHPETNEPVYHEEKCLYCADCIRACPTGAWGDGKIGWLARAGGRHGRHPVNGKIFARFITDEMVGPVIEKVLEWYHKAGEGKGRIRISTFLMEDGAMKDFVAHMADTLGEYAEKNPKAPESNEIIYPAP